MPDDIVVAVRVISKLSPELADQLRRAITAYRRLWIDNPGTRSVWAHWVAMMVGATGSRLKFANMGRDGWRRIELVCVAELDRRGVPSA